MDPRASEVWPHASTVLAALNEVASKPADVAKDRLLQVLGMGPDDTAVMDCSAERKPGLEDFEHAMYAAIFARLEADDEAKEAEVVRLLDAGAALVVDLFERAARPGASQPETDRCKFWWTMLMSVTEDASKLIPSRHLEGLVSDWERSLPRLRAAFLAMADQRLKEFDAKQLAGAAALEDVDDKEKKRIDDRKKLIGVLGVSPNGILCLALTSLLKQLSSRLCSSLHAPLRARIVLLLEQILAMDHKAIANNQKLRSQEWTKVEDLDAEADAGFPEPPPVVEQVAEAAAPAAEAGAAEAAAPAADAQAPAAEAAAAAPDGAAASSPPDAAPDAAPAADAAAATADASAAGAAGAAAPDAAPAADATAATTDGSAAGGAEAPAAAPAAAAEAPAGGAEAAPAAEAPAAALSLGSDPVVTFELYRSFWSLQEALHFPEKIFDRPDGWKVFHKTLSDVLALFLKHPVQDHAHQPWTPPEPAPLRHAPRGRALPVQLDDPGFREQFLIQAMIAFHALDVDASSYRKDIMSRQGTQTQKEFQALRRTCEKALEQTREGFPTLLRHLFEREGHWVAWKAFGCREFKHESLEMLNAKIEPADCLPEKPASLKAPKIQMPPHVRSMLGTLKDPKWNLPKEHQPVEEGKEDTADDIRQNMLRKLCDTYLDRLLEEDDPKNEVEDEYKAKKNKVFMWQARRLFAQKHLRAYSTRETNTTKFDFMDYVRTVKGINVVATVADTSAAEAPPAEGAIAGTIPEAPAIADAAPADAAPADAAAAPADAAPASAAPDDATMEPAGGAGAAVAEAPSAASAADAPADAAPAAAVEIDGEAGQQTSTAGKRSADTAGVVAEPEAKKAKT